MAIIIATSNARNPTNGSDLSPSMCFLMFTKNIYKNKSRCSLQILESIADNHCGCRWRLSPENKDEATTMGRKMTMKMMIIVYLGRV
jgi:hypothetical protein